MCYYTANMESLKRYRKNIYERLIDLLEHYNASEGRRVFSSPSREGSFTLAISFEGKDYRMNSAYQPLKEAKQWASQFILTNLGIVISMYGLGNGIFARQLADRMDKSMTILVYEPNLEVFLHVINNYDLTDLLENPKILITVEGLNGEEFKKKLYQVITYTNLNSQIVCVHPQYDKVFLDDSLKFLRVISENNNQVEINRNTNAFFGRDIIENTIKNLKFVRNANTVFDLISDEFNDIPAIIVSAGPSLDKNIDLLREAKGKSVIVATDTAMQFLRDHEIVPDCFVTLDPLKPESYLKDTGFIGVPLFTKVESNWRILHKHKTRKIFYSCQPYMELLFEKLGKKISNYNSGGSVATGAFSVCAALGFKKIILIGQDLAFAGERTHAGNLFDKAPGEEKGIRYVEGIDGGKVRTRHDWYLYLKWFEAAIDLVKDRIEVIDATEGGAKIPGTQVMSLRTAIDHFCSKEINFAEILACKPNTLNTQEICRLYELMERTAEELVGVRQKAEEAAELCETVLKELSYDNSITPSLIKKSQKLGKINSQIENTAAYKLLDAYISELSMNLLSSIYQFTSDEEEDRRQTYRKAHIFYQTIASGAAAIKSMMEEALTEFWKDDLRPMAKRVVAVLQTGRRITKVQDKLMNILKGKTVLEHTVERLRQSDKIDEIVLAMTVKEEDDVIAEEGARLGVNVLRGKEGDNLALLYDAGKDYRANIIVRLEAASPLADPLMIDLMIEYYLANNYDLVTNVDRATGQRFLHGGLKVEIISVEKLGLAYLYARESSQREKDTSYLYEKCNIGHYIIDNNEFRYEWILEEEKDWSVIEEIYQHLYQEKHDFYLEDILKVMSHYSEQ